MEIHLKTHKTTAPYTGVWQKQALDRVSDCISFLRTKQQTAPGPDVANAMSNPNFVEKSTLRGSDCCSIFVQH